MAQYTPNFNLYEPDTTDDFADFRTEFNNNMDIIDQNLGGGGGSGGHTIIDENGQSMTQRTGLEFTGNVQVTDDSVNDKTIVDILGGGGNVYGAFLDPSRVVYSAFTFDSSTHSWTATEDCILTDNMTPPDGSTAYFIRIDGKQVFAGYSTVEDPFVYVKKGQVVEYRAKSGSTMKAYGITQGTNGIFAPVIYSDNERVIGVWRDNKPLYQKTLVVNNLNLDTSGTAIDITSLGVEMCTPIFGGSFYIVSGVKRGFAKLEYQEPNEVYLYPAVNRSNTTCYVTIQYTKTADVAGSGNWNTDGVPTVHYDTNEQVVGTWLGKPLYQNVLTLTQDTNLIADTWVKTEFARTTMQNLIKVVAVIGSSGAVIEALSGGFIDDKLSLNSARNVGLNVADTARLIVQYTKTTD